MGVLRLLLFLLCLGRGFGLHITGTWENSAGNYFQIIAKFGFQMTDYLQLDHTRGLVYGNITRSEDRKSVRSEVLLALVDRAYFPVLYENSKNSFSCDTALEKLSTVAFDHRCFTRGKQDFFRWVPCPSNSICPDEDNPANLVPGSQLTFKIQNKYAAGFWYLILVACRLDTACNWTSIADPVSIDYDLWLVNGDPTVKYSNPFEHQFSFDEQDTPEIYLVAAVVFLTLTLLQLKACRMFLRAPRRSRALLVISTILTLSSLFNLTHVFIYAFDGRGALFLRWIGDILSITGTGLLVLLLLLLARGWSVSHSENKIPYWIYCVWGAMEALDFALFVWNSQAVDAIEEVDIFETRPGQGILVLRVVFLLWFLVELRRTVSAEVSEEKIRFLVHFGAGFMVWFIYLPVLGIVASTISLLWRFKVILSVSYLANFLGLAILAHLFWPQSTNRRFFLDKDTVAGMTLLPQEDLEEFEKDLGFLLELWVCDAKKTNLEILYNIPYGKRWRHADSDANVFRGEYCTESRDWFFYWLVSLTLL